MNVRATRFPLFDSLRAMAALAVLGTHAGVLAGLYTGHSTLGRYAARLEVGVAVFFLISGFLLYRPFVRSRVNAEPRPSVGSFAWRRFLRIVPGYWAALTLTAVCLSLPGVFAVKGLMLYGFAQTYDRWLFGSGLGQAWTLCIEIVFYAFLPLWAGLMRALPGRSRRARLTGDVVGLGALFVGSIAYKLVVLSTLDSHAVQITPVLIALPAYLDQFAIGMGLAVLSVWLERRDALPRGLAVFDRWPSLSWAISLVAFWAVSTQIGFTARLYESWSSTQYMERHLLFAVVALGLLIPAVIGDQGRGVVRRILANRFLLYLGLISYGIYLYTALSDGLLRRWGFASLVPDTGSGTLVFAVWVLGDLAVTVLIASASYWLLERPVLKLKRLVGGGEAAPGEAIAEPAAVSVPPARAG